MNEASVLTLTVFLCHSFPVISLQYSNRHQGNGIYKGNHNNGPAELEITDSCILAVTKYAYLLKSKL